MQLVHPEALLLVPLAALVMRGWLWPRPLLGTLRVLVVVMIALVLARPSQGTVDDGRDVVLVVDRSRSMPEDSLTDARELARQVANELLSGDRIGVVEFGEQAAVIASPSDELRWPEAKTPVDRDGSDLAAAISTALALVQDGRQATMVIVSDGEVDGEQSLGVAQLAARRSVRIDVEPVPRVLGRDAAVDDVRTPAEVPAFSPFAIESTVLTTHAGRATWRLIVDGEELRKGTVQLRAGRNVLQLQHRFREPGEHRIEFECQLPADTVQQNDRGLAVVRATARTRILCVTPGGREDRLTRSLQAVGIEVVVSAPETAPLTIAQLDGFRAVVLEDVAASTLPAGAMKAVATWVRDLGGGLLMTGGQQSYGVGGYYQSPIEEVLPVTMEIREEQRRFGLAMAIALDRSGSMQAQAGDTTKMQLANRGAAGAVELLSSIDAVAVMAVDTAPEVVVPLRGVDDVEGISELVRSIESGGGGIYVGEALHECADQLEEATQSSRHIVLFADADDAEEADDYRTFVPKLVEQGVTVSVIGLGADTGRDASLLEDIASLGGGRCQFVADAEELPRVFAQETIQVARSSLVEEPTAVQSEPSLLLLGNLPQALPMLGGYSIAWMRERGDQDLTAADERAGPLLAHWQVGLGRAAAFLGEADGELSGEWATWEGYADFFGTLSRWLCGGSTTGVFVDARRDGDVGVYQIEVEADRAALLESARGMRSAPDGSTHELVLQPKGDGIVEVRVPLRQAGVHRAALKIGDDTVRLPPLCRPYSAEWSQQLDARAGERNLRRLARRTGGAVTPSVTQILAGPRESMSRRDLGWLFALLAMVLLVTEIAMRRLQVHLPTPSLGRARKPARVGDQPAKPAKVVTPKDEVVATKSDDAKADAGNLLSALERAQQRGKKRV